MGYNEDMIFNWDDDKNQWLKEERGISFEEIVICIHENRVMDVIKHPNKEKYPGQLMFVIDYKEYIYVVPFVEEKKGEEIFLKTIYQSRRYTKLYMWGGKRNV